MSSDSEDDWYGNVIERLQKMKDQFNEKQTETVNLYDDSGELDEIVKNCVLPPKGKRKSGNKNLKDTPDCSVSDISNISIDNVINNATKRVTRSSTRKSGVDVSDGVTLPPSRREPQGEGFGNSDSGSTSSRGRGRGRSRGKSPRGRGRGGGRARRNRQAMIPEVLQALNSIDPSIPIYSIGNTAEYPDELHSQPLFKNQQKNDEVVLVGEDDSFDDNEELSVKVYWQSSEIFKFTIRRYQKLTQIFEYFVKKENVDRDKLLFTFQEKILKPDDTPDSIDYSIVKFIEGGIVTQGVLDLVTKDSGRIKDGIKLKFQCQKLKKPHEITIRLDDKLSLAMMQFSEHIETPIEKLKFEFDGDSISGKLSARDLEFEGGECIDVRIIS